jgi:thioester reductase-like protein
MFPIVRTGAFNDKDFMIRLLIGCLQHKAAPDLGFYFSAVPADHVAGTELFPQTFWNVAREFSSFSRQGAATGERR